MTDTLTLDPPAAASSRDGVFLCEVLRANEPLRGSHRYRIDDVDEVRLGRGETDVAERMTEGSRAVLTLSLRDGAASSQHALITRRGQAFVLADQGSKNGTRLDGRKTDSTLLRDGQLIEIGQTAFLFRRMPLPPGNSERPPAPAPLTSCVPSLQRSFDRLVRAAPSAIPVLLLGPTGSGKEVVARALHNASGRRGELVAVNCAAIPEHLAESQLFGHRRGAFSGAHQDQPGLIRQAHNGTLLLDEIGDLSLDTQAKLLRVLQEGKVLALGAAREEAVDVRVVSATHRDLSAMVSAGHFREDLFARLEGLTVTLPPLSDRREDLGMLIASLLPAVAGDRAAAIRFSPEAARALISYSWPRNIRELKQTLSLATTLHTDPAGALIRLEDLPERIRNATRDPAPPILSDEDAMLRDRVVAALQQCHGNVTHTAEQLGCKRQQVQKWCRRLGIEPARYRR